MEQLLALEATPVPKINIEARSLDDELYLMDPDNPACEVYCLNGSAAIIWLLIDGSRDLAGITKEISDAFTRPECEVLAEVRKAVEHLQSLNLLEI